MKTRISIALLFCGVLTSCGPAAESRERMDEQARHMSDSISLQIDSALRDPAKETGLLKPEAQISATGFTPAVRK